MQFLSMRELFSRYSTIAVAIMMGAAEYWLQLSPQEQQALLQTYPVLIKLVPLAGFLVFLGARGLVQNTKQAAAKIAKDSYQ